MRFSPDIDSELWKQLKDKGATPPHEMIGALLSFGTPEKVLTYQIRKDDQAGTRAGWLSVARVAGGLLIVEASSDDEHWSWADNHEKTRNETVAATWFPVTKITGIALRKARALRGSRMSSMDGVTVEGTWLIHVDGREDPLTFDRAPGHDQSLAIVEDFCLQLLAEVSGATARPAR